MIGAIEATGIATLATDALGMLGTIYTAATGNALLALWIGVSVIGAGCAAFAHVKHTVR